MIDFSLGGYTILKAAVHVLYKLSGGWKYSLDKNILGTTTNRNKIFDWKNIDKTQVVYIGHQGVKPNGSDGFVFNPSGEGGSMDGMNSYLRNMLGWD